MRGWRPPESRRGPDLGLAKFARNPFRGGGAPARLRAGRRRGLHGYPARVRDRRERALSVTHESAEAVFAAYVDCHARNDRAGVLALFEPDAVVEDPVGAPAYHGIEAIEGFYAETHARNGTLSIERVGGSLFGGGEFAVHVRASLDAPGSPPAMDVIYVIELADSGRIRSLRAWY